MVSSVWQVAGYWSHIFLTYGGHFFGYIKDFSVAFSYCRFVGLFYKHKVNEGLEIDGGYLILVRTYFFISKLLSTFHLLIYGMGVCGSWGLSKVSISFMERFVSMLGCITRCIRCSGYCFGPEHLRGSWIGSVFGSLLGGIMFTSNSVFGKSLMRCSDSLFSLELFLLISLRFIWLRNFVLKEKNTTVSCVSNCSLTVSIGGRSDVYLCG